MSVQPQIYAVNDMLESHGILYSALQCQSLLQKLIVEVEWQTDFQAYGRNFDLPRLQAWYADEGVHYRQSDNKMLSNEWTTSLLSIKHAVEAQSGHGFNSVLLTFYRDGNDMVGWHADDEAELGEAPVIASLSLGATRQFRYRHKITTQQDSMQLHDGELIVMQPVFQQYWEHSVLPEPGVDGPRINLTFRQVIA